MYLFITCRQETEVFHLTGRLSDEQFIDIAREPIPPDKAGSASVSSAQEKQARVESHSRRFLESIFPGDLMEEVRM